MATASTVLDSHRDVRPKALIAQLEHILGRASNVQAAALIVLVAAALPRGAWASEWTFDAGVSARETYTDNVRLANTNAESDFMTEVNPFFTASLQSARAKVDARYTMNNVFYLLGNADNRVNHQLGAKLESELYQDHFFLDATASYSQQITSLLGPVGAGGSTAAADNVTDVGIYTITPYWKQRFGSTANAELRYTNSGQFYSTNDLDRSQLNGISGIVSSGSDFKHPWSVGYNYRTISYRTQPDVSFETVYGSAGYAFTPRFRLNGTLGYENNDYVSIGENPNGRFWNITGSWRPSVRTSLDVGYGDYYWGNALNLAFNHRRVSSTWELSYSESVSTSSSQFTGLILFPPTTGGGGIIGTSPIINNSVSKNDTLRGAARYHHGKSDYGLNLYYTNQQSLTVQSIILAGTNTPASNHVKIRGIGFDWNWRYSSLIQTRLNINATSNNYVDLDRTDDYQWIELGVHRRFSPHLNGDAFVRHQRRNSDVAGQGYDESAIGAGVTYTF